MITISRERRREMSQSSTAGESGHGHIIVVIDGRQYNYISSEARIISNTGLSHLSWVVDAGVALSASVTSTEVQQD